MCIRDSMQLVSFAIVFWENPKGSNHVGLINSQSKAGWLPSIGTNGYLLPILIVLALMVILFVYMRYSKQGYEIAVVGESENTAHYAGINVPRVIIRTMAICGGIGGGAQAALAEAGIKLYGGVSGEADAAVKALLSGNLGYDPNVHCDHHNHEHGEAGHACGDHGCGKHSCH